jgi:hypothetical protein
MTMPSGPWSMFILGHPNFAFSIVFDIHQKTIVLEEKVGDPKAHILWGLSNLKKHPLCLTMKLKWFALFAIAFSLTDVNPVGGLVTGSFETICIDKG